MVQRFPLVLRLVVAFVQLKILASSSVRSECVEFESQKEPN